MGIPEARAIAAEWLSTALNRTGAFERLSSGRLMDEHNRSLTGLTHQATIAEIGRLRGTQALMTGSVSEFGHFGSVTPRESNQTTAKVINSGDIKVKALNPVAAEIDSLAWELVK